MRERGTGVSSLPLNTECQLLGIKYRPEYPAINLILQFISLTGYSKTRYTRQGVGRGGGGGGRGGAWPPIKSGQGAKKGHMFWPHLAYPLLTNISW